MQISIYKSVYTLLFGRTDYLPVVLIIRVCYLCVCVCVCVLFWLLETKVIK